MDAHNISVCVAPSMFHKLDRPNDVESSFKAIAFVEFLINNTEALFGADTMSLLKSTIETNNNNIQTANGEYIKSGNINKIIIFNFIIKLKNKIKLFINLSN